MKVASIRIISISLCGRTFKVSLFSFRFIFAVLDCRSLKPYLIFRLVPAIISKFLIGTADFARIEALSSGKYSVETENFILVWTGKTCHLCPWLILFDLWLLESHLLQFSLHKTESFLILVAGKHIWQLELECEPRDVGVFSIDSLRL